MQTQSFFSVHISELGGVRDLREALSGPSMCFRVKVWLIGQQFILHLSAYQSLVPEPFAPCLYGGPNYGWA